MISGIPSVSLRSYGAALLAATALFSSQLSAQSVVTEPVGFMNTTLAPSPNGTTRQFTAVSFPLHTAAVFTGTVATNGVSGNTITLNNAALGNLTATPYILQVKSAANATATGRTFVISSSTATSVTVTSAAFQVSTILAANDQVTIYPANTLSSIFGTTDQGVTPSVLLQAGIAAEVCDNVYIFSNNTWQTYYYYTGYGWILNGDPNFTIQNNKVILPDSGVLVGRVSTNALPSTYASISGAIPVNQQTQNLMQTASTFSFISNPLPTAVTFVQFGFTSSQGWVSGIAAEVSDNVYLFSNNTWQTYYYYTGYGWILNGDPNFTIQDNTPISSGAAMLVLRRSTLSGTNASVVTPLNYSLN